MFSKALQNEGNQSTDSVCHRTSDTNMPPGAAIKKEEKPKQV
jgi:hypothetical protein